MRTYFRYILIALLSCAVSCTTNDEIADPNSEGKMSLRLVSSAMTRASDAQHNEDFLDKVDLYLFGSTTEASKWHTTIDTNANGSITLNGENEIYIPASALNSVGNSPKLYVIANYDNTTSPLPESATLAELQKQVVAKASWGPTAETEAWKAQSSFVMEGLGDVTKNGNQLSGTVNLKRAAAKIDLSITDIVDQVVSGDYVWKPVVGAAHALNVTMKNAVTTSYVGADWDKTYEYFGTNGSTVNYTFKAETSSTVDGVTTTPYSQTYPFYSYSSDQAKGANEAYMVLVVPWQKYDKKNNNAVGDVENLYYEVPIGGRDNKRIERNYHYKVSIYVGTLGSTSKDESVTLEPEITVVDWSTGQIAVDIKEAKYLVVDEKIVEIFNKNEHKITFSASHPEKTTVKILSVTRDDLKGNIAGTTTFYSDASGIETVSAGNWDDSETYKLMKDCSVRIDGGEIVFSHDLVNTDENTNDNADGYPTSGDSRNRDDYDFTPYYITLLVEMKVDNSTTFKETITITQYPQVYIKASQNSDYDGGDNTSNNADRNTMVNGYYSNNQSGSYIYKVNTKQSTFGTVPGLVSNADNRNPNMYVVTVTSISPDSPYIIGDPRESKIDTDLVNATNDNGSIWVNTAALYDGPSRTLKYYYPTDRTMTGNDDEEPADYATGYMIAPKFRVASSYSVTHGPLDDVDAAERRCASYQEDGYPAGRWRLPTYAEAAFIVGLSNEKKIPYLFNTGTYYWCAHGQFKPSATGVELDNGDDAYSVRCVYDEWYWGSEQLPNTSTFTWGDMPR